MCYDFLKAHCHVWDNFFTAECPLEWWKILFISSWKLFVLKIFKFLSWLFGHVEKRLDEKGKVNLKIYDVATWLTSNCNAHITWKMFFLKNHTQNVMEKLFPDPVLKNQNWAYLWMNSLKFYIVYFYCMLSWGLSKYIETKLQTIYFYLI